MMDIPVIGLVENMSYYQCPDCGRRAEIVAKSRAAETAGRSASRKSCACLYVPTLRALWTKGFVEDADEEIVKSLEELIK